MFFVHLDKEGPPMLTDEHPWDQRESVFYELLDLEIGEFMSGFDRCLAGFGSKDSIQDMVKIDLLEIEDMIEQERKVYGILDKDSWNCIDQDHIVRQLTNLKSKCIELSDFLLQIGDLSYLKFEWLQ